MFEAMRDVMATGHVGWAMGGSMALFAAALILGVVSVCKYIVFR